jgi:hypothetical protein
VSAAEKRLGAGAVALGCLAFLGAWWNASSSPTGGSELFFMEPSLQALLPYRDLAYQSPPGMVMLYRAVAALTGPRLVALLAVGVLVRTAGALAAYGLLLRAVRPAHAAAGVLVAVVVSSTDIADTPIYYNHVWVSLALCGAWALVRGLEARGAARLALAALGGLAVAASLSMKQPAVFGAMALGLGLVPLARVGSGEGRRPWGAVAAAVAGGLMGAGVVVAWLAQHGLVGDFLAAMQAAPGSKGGVGTSLLRPLTLLLQLPRERAAEGAGALVVAAAAAVWARRGGVARRWAGWPFFVVAPALLALAGGSLTLRGVTLTATAVGFLGCLAVAVGAAWSWRAGARSARDAAVLLLALLGAGVAYASAVSWPLFESMAFPAVGVVLALALEWLAVQEREALRGALVAGALALTGLAGAQKEREPASWGFWRDPPLSSPGVVAPLPEYEGMRLSAPAAAFLGGVTELVAARTGADEPLYVFPNLPVLYALTGRRPATFGLAHWVDLCPDQVAARDARTLLERPPHLIVRRRDTLAQVAGEEALFRAGAHSGVRAVFEALEELRPRYRLVWTFTDAATAPIDVWELAGRPSPATPAEAPATSPDR